MYKKSKAKKYTFADTIALLAVTADLFTTFICGFAVGVFTYVCTGMIVLPPQSDAGSDHLKRSNFE